MTALSELLAERLAAHTDVRRWVIAFSGGLDSTVLLHLCARLPLSAPLLACHVDHQLQADSARWLAHCAQQCQALGVPFIGEQVCPRDASEAAARDARYAVFERLLQPGDCLLLAQHAGDQSETLLLRLLRGAGVPGLAAMPAQRRLGRGLLLRPLLDQPRQRLEVWAAQQQLSWIEDPSNQSDHYARNWLRRQILPVLRQRYPGLDQRVSATTGQFREANEILDERAQEDLQALQAPMGGIDLLGLQSLSLARQRNLLRYWVYSRLGLRLSMQALAQCEALMTARADRNPQLQLGEHWLCRYRGHLYLRRPAPPPSVPQSCRVSAGQFALQQGQLSFAFAAQGLAPGQLLALDYRQGGERLRPLGRGGSVSLKQLLQEAGVPPWLRDSWPLLLSQGRIQAVPGICLCEEAAVDGGLWPQWMPFGLSDGGCFGRL